MARIAAGEGVQHGVALALVRVGGEAGNQEARRDLQRHPVRSGEDHARLIGMQPQDIFDYPELLRRPMDEGELPAVGAEDRAGLGVGPRQARQVGPLEVRLSRRADDGRARTRRESRSNSSCSSAPR